MLKYFRKKTIAKIIFWGLIILILPAFVLWGVGSLSRSRKDIPRFVGIINKKKVSFEELSKSLIGIRSQIILNFFNQQEVLDAFLKDKSLLARLAWDRLIMLEEANRHKIRISDKDLIGYIRSHPIFSRGGEFDSKIYEYVLRYHIGISARAFEEIVRENFTIQRLKDAVTKEIKVTDEDVLNEYKKENVEFDEKKFEREKEEFRKKYLEKKRLEMLDVWFREVSLRASLNIDLADIEKYYR